MPPRKSPSPGAVLGLSPAATSATGASSLKDEPRRKIAKADPSPLTSDERSFLATITSAAAATTGAGAAAAGPWHTPPPTSSGRKRAGGAVAAAGSGAGTATATAATAAAAGARLLLDDSWWNDTAVPRLTALTEKVLAVAAAQYLAGYKDMTTAREASLNGGGGVGVGSSSNVIAGGGGGGDGYGNAGSMMRNGNTGGDGGGGGGGGGAPPAGTPAQFAEENAYLVDQLRQIPQCPFSVERLAEILADPPTARPAALQAALRRCILVTYPVIVAMDDGMTNEE